MKTTSFLSKKMVYVTIFSLFTFSLLAQQNNPEENPIGLQLLDEESFFVGGLSASVLTQGKVEVNFYSALFSNQIALHESIIESPIRDRLRLSEFSSNVDVYFGTSRSGRWDIGARFKYARRRVDNAAISSPFEVFKSRATEAENDFIDKTYSGLKEIGFRFRLIPFEKIPELTLTGGYSFSPIRSTDNKEEKGLGAERSNLDLNLAYYVGLNNNSYYYFIVNGIASPSNKIEGNSKWLYSTDVSFYIVQLFANRKLALYPGLSYHIGFKPPEVLDDKLIKTSEQVLGILGVQYQAANNISLNISTAYPILLETSNKLVQQIRESYSFVSLGGRIIF